MLIDLLEELIPSSDQFALGLVLNQLKFILSPAFFNVPEEFLKDQFTSGLSKHLIDNLFVFDQVGSDQVRYGEFVEADLFKGELGKQVLPVPRFHCFALELPNDLVHLDVLGHQALVLGENGQLPASVVETVHGLSPALQFLIDCLEHIRAERRVEDGLYRRLPHLL